MPQKPPAPRPAPPRRDGDCPEYILQMREWLNPDSPVWKCGCPRLQILHSTKAKAFEGSPFLDCFTCGEKRRSLRYSVFYAGFLALLLTLGVCFAAWSLVK